MAGVQLGREHIQVSVDERGILHIDEQRRMTEASVAMMRAKLEAILASGQRPNLVMLDLTGVELSFIIPLRGKVAESAALIDPRRIAVVSSSRLMWVIVSFIMNLSGTKEATQAVQIFRSREEAEKWLLKGA